MSDLTSEEMAAFLDSLSPDFLATLLGNDPLAPVCTCGGDCPQEWAMYCPGIAAQPAVPPVPNVVPFAEQVYTEVGAAPGNFEIGSGGDLRRLSGTIRRWGMSAECESMHEACSAARVVWDSVG